MDGTMCSSCNGRPVIITMTVQEAEYLQRQLRALESAVDTCRGAEMNSPLFNVHGAVAIVNSNLRQLKEALDESLNG